MHRRRRQQDKHGKFLPWQSINLNEGIEEEEVELPFEDASLVFLTKSSSREKYIDTSGLQPFAEILANFLDNTTPNPPIVNNPILNVPF